MVGRGAPCADVLFKGRVGDAVRPVRVGADRQVRPGETVGERCAAGDVHDRSESGEHDRHVPRYVDVAGIDPRRGQRIGRRETDGAAGPRGGGQQVTESLAAGPLTAHERRLRTQRMSGLVESLLKEGLHDPRIDTAPLSVAVVAPSARC